MAKNDNPFRLSWETDEDNMTATAVLKEKDANGDMQEVDRRTFDVEPIEEAGLIKRAALYGVTKVMQDRSSDTPSGPGKLDAMSQVYDQLKSGQWKAERSGGGGGGVAPEVEAIAEVKGTSISAAAKAWKEQSDEQKDAIREKLADKIEEVKARRKDQGELDLSDL